MGQSASFPVPSVDAVEDELRRAAVEELERMERKTAENEALALAKASGAPLSIAPDNAFVGPEDDERSKPSNLLFGDSLLDPPSRSSCDRAANHILSAIAGGKFELLTAAIADALGHGGIRTELRILNGVCAFGSHEFWLESPSMSPISRVIRHLPMIAIPDFVKAPLLLGTALVSNVIYEPATAKQLNDERFYKRYGFARHQLLADNTKAFWNAEEGDTVLELALKPVFPLLHSPDVIARQIRRVLHRLLELDSERTDASKAAWLCRAIVRSRRAMNTGFGASKARNEFRFDAAMDVLQACCANHWEPSGWEGSIGRICRCMAELPTLGRTPLRTALLEELTLMVWADLQPGGNASLTATHSRQHAQRGVPEELT